jgi:hypothetical protein
MGLYIRLSYFHPFQQFFIHIDKFYLLFSHYSSKLPTLNNVEKIIWPTVYAVLGVVVHVYVILSFTSKSLRKNKLVVNDDFCLASDWSTSLHHTLCNLKKESSTLFDSLTVYKIFSTFRE